MLKEKLENGLASHDEVKGVVNLIKREINATPQCYLLELLALVREFNARKQD